MTQPPPPDAQLARFREAVALLGGALPAAAYLHVSERQMRGLLSGERTLHDGYLRDVAQALIAHADKCRAAERRLSPAFAGNLTEAQTRGTANRGRRTDLEARRKTKPIAEHMAEVHAHAIGNYRTPRRWEINEAGMEELKRYIDLPTVAEVTEFMGVPVARMIDHATDPRFKLFIEEDGRG